MMTPARSAALIEAVEGSPQAVARHDKDAWLQLFDEDFQLQDPVGSLTIDTPKRLSQFYQSFIAPNQIEFVRQRDYVGCDGDDCYSVWRDLTLKIQLSEQVQVCVPMHLHYQLRDSNNRYRIRRLAAHWELGAMLLQLLPYGLAALRCGWHLSGNILRNLGSYGMAGFTLALLTPTPSHRKLLTAVLKQQHTVALVGANTAPLAQHTLADYRVIKTVSAGRHITASLQRHQEHALLVLERSHRLGAISRARLFQSDDCTAMETTP